MKKLMKLFLIFTIGLFLACSPKNEEAPFAIFSGKISNFVEDTSLIVKLKNEALGIEKTLLINKDGSFKDTIYKVDKANMYTLDFFEKPNESRVIFRENVYLTSGSHVSFNMELKKSKTSVFSGDLANENNFLTKKNQLEMDFYGEKSAVFKLDEETFLKKNDSLKNSLEEMLKNSTNLDANFYTYMEKDNKYADIMRIRMYQYLFYYNNSPSLKEDSEELELTEEDSELTEEDIKVSAKYPDVQKLMALDTPYNESDFINIMGYRDIVITKFLNIMDEANVSEFKKYSIFLEKLKLSPSSIIKNYMLKIYSMFMYRSVFNAKEKEEIYQKIKLLSTDTSYIKKLTEDYLADKKNDTNSIGENKISPKFENYTDINGKSFSLDDFKGKYVYIDVWATWCGPCKAELPYWKKLVKKFENKNIVFLGISVDDKEDIATWKKMIVAEKIPGIQLIADKAFKSSFVKKYKINSIPRYILINPDGTILDEDALRPSYTEEIENILNNFKY